METLALPSPAKLNLFLHITGRRADGYHNLQTLFQFIDFCDTLHFNNTDSPGEIKLTPDIDGVPKEQNLIYRAAKLLRKATDCELGASIHLEKQLPMGGGLGGGSSNAATTIVALNHLWRTGLNQDQLADLGNQLGADVPVFVRGKAAVAEGTGEILTPVDIQEPWYLILVPDCHVETAALFADKHLTRNSNPITLRAVLNTPLGELGHNDFEPVARSKFSAIEEGLTLLSGYGSAKLTGTGACLFCDFHSQEEAEKAQRDLSNKRTEHRFRSHIAAGHNQSPLHSRLNELSY
ncbi:MAG: 4-(cytidine 5'-diphospho)-2-C-methyl-D-erythritol kinase [Pseudomonadales bacterium]|nr:4-(cytidine 5'-diphospho)-2-C-methyl-D-erythritol kinase [Pseudomonadales bacterium]